MTEADQLRSIQDKLKLGGKLTAAERKIVQSAQRPPQFFATLEEIAAHYGVSHTAVGKWVAQEPDGFARTDQGYAAQDVAAARKRILAKGTKVRLCAGDIANKNAENAADPSKSITESEIFEDLETLKARKMTLECQKMLTQIEILMKLYVRKNVVVKELRTMLYGLRDALMRVPAEVCYAVSGKIPVEAQEIISDALRRVLSRVDEIDFARFEAALDDDGEGGGVSERLPAARETNGRAPAP